MILTVGIPKEEKKLEMRVGMTPEGVARLAGLRIPVIVQKGAGELSGFRDADYEKAGAVLVKDLRELYERASIIQKVKEPQPSEFPLLSKRHVIFSFLHLASPENAPVIAAFLESGSTGIGFETLEIRGGRPILKPMSEVAGGLSAPYAALLKASGLLERKVKNKSETLEALRRIAALYPKVPDDLRLENVIIWGGGIAGEAAAKFSSALGAETTVVENNTARAEWLRASLKGKIAIVAPSGLSHAALEKAEIFIGCVHKTGERAFHVMDRDQLAAACAAKRKIIMDVAIDQGGNFPMAHATTYDDPVYYDDFGNLRFAVANIPSFCGRAASAAITEAAAPYTEAMALDFERALARYPELSSAVNIRAGRIAIQSVRTAYEKRD